MYYFLVVILFQLENFYPWVSTDQPRQDLKKHAYKSMVKSDQNSAIEELIFLSRLNDKKDDSKKHYKVAQLKIQNKSTEIIFSGL